MNDRYHVHLLLVVTVLVYLVLGCMFAALTPRWQVPDEPAHYNYIRQLAAGGLPILEIGDYDPDYLEMLKAQRFPPGADLAAIQYEDHQPPLFYLLLTPVFVIFDGALLPLRIVSVLLGAGVVVIAFFVGRLAFPDRPLAWATATILVALIPQHIAMMAGVNNDSLSELLLASTLLFSVALIKGRGPRSPWPLGLLLGAAFLAKSQAYVAAPVFGLAILMRWRQNRESTSWLLRWLVGVVGLGLLIGAIWWARNLVVYGDLDWMGLVRHELVVQGQPTTAAWISRYGLPATLERFVQFTFKSFWGVFGWMGVFLHPRIYQGLWVFSAVTALGWLLSMDRLKTQLTAPAVLLATSAGLSAAGYLWYNVTFVQHQGRYLFPALIPLGLAAGVAWNALTLRRQASFASLVALGASCTIALSGLAQGDLTAYMVGLALALAGGFWLITQMPLRLRWVPIALLGLMLALLDAASLYLSVIPSLT